MKTNATNHSLRLIEFARELARAGLPSAVAAQAKRCLLDNLGCGLFGASRPWSQIMLAEVKSDGSTGPCTAFGCEHGMAAAAAALANGCAIHGFELDDLIASALVHPGTVIVPAVLAAAEAAGSSGSQTLAAIVAGYEATARISLALGVEPSQRGFHKTSVVGPVAAAIAAGTAMELTVTQLQNAVGLACSMASGIKAFAAGAGGRHGEAHACRAGGGSGRARGAACAPRLHRTCHRARWPSRVAGSVQWHGRAPRASRRRPGQSLVHRRGLDQGLPDVRLDTIRTASDRGSSSSWPAASAGRHSRWIPMGRPPIR